MAGYATVGQAYLKPFRNLPGLPEVAHQLRRLHYLARLRAPRRIEIVVEPASGDPRDEGQALLHGDGIASQIGVLLRPLFDVLFRTEEAHVVSGMDNIGCPLLQRDAKVQHDGLGLAGEDLAIFGLHHDGVVAVRAIAVDIHLLAGEHLADRQTLQCSLRIPFPLAINLYLVWGGDV